MRFRFANRGRSSNTAKSGLARSVRAYINMRSTSPFGVWASVPDSKEGEVSNMTLTYYDGRVPGWAELTCRVEDEKVLVPTCGLGWDDPKAVRILAPFLPLPFLPSN